MSLPILTVVGALGKQGQGVISAFLDEKATLKVQIRALTSNKSSPAALELAQKPNVSVVEVDLNSVESVEAAFQGSSYLFINSNFNFEIFIAKGPEGAEEAERTQKLNLVHAASRTPTLKHVVCSTLPDAKTVSNGKWHIPHFQSKIPADEFLLDPKNGLSDKTTFLLVGMYAGNITRPPSRPILNEETNSYVITMACDPDAKLPFIGDEVVNTGLYVKSILEQPHKSLGHFIVGVAEYLSCSEWAGLFQLLHEKTGTGAKVSFEQYTLEDAARVDGAAGTEFNVMMAYISEYGERSFELATWGWPVLSAGELGIKNELRGTRENVLEIKW